MYDLPIDPYARPKKNKDADFEAVNSPLNRIPGIELHAVRDLLDIGISQVYELSGRSPDVLYEEIRKKKPATPRTRIASLRLAVYYAETPSPEQSKLSRWAWQD
ncbi:MAG: helix-hairpin-helix domain-containing protein [Verrucomicrobiota bacterium]|nr:helix-hairpin-helix domain-containing protein [Verrucomicrobiota bacterium]